MSNLLIPVHTQFEQNAQLFADKTAVSEGSKEITYSGLNRKANELAHFLLTLPLSESKVVGYMGNAGIGNVLATLSIMKAGAVYMPLDKAIPGERIAQILKETQCKVLVINAGELEQTSVLINAQQLPVQSVVVLGEGDEAMKVYKVTGNEWTPALVDQTLSSENPDLKIEIEDPAYLIYTSGSTGSGKPILGNHKGLSHFIAWQRKEFGIAEDFRVGQVTSIGFDASLRDLFLPLTSGACLYVPEEKSKFNLPVLVNWLQEKAINLIHTVPSVFRLLTKEIGSSNADMSALHYLFLAGEKMYAKDVHQWRAQAGEHTELINLYGTSETTMAKTFHRIKDVSADPSQPLHVGNPIDGAFVVILNEENKLCRIGELGTVYIKTPYRTLGYYNQPELNAERFVQNPLVEQTDILHHTGDVGRYGEGRVIEIIGRKDDQVKINGIRTELHEIERHIESFPSVDQSVVIARENDANQSELVAYYVCAEDQTDALRNYLGERLGEQLVPSYFMRIDELPLNINGKVNKKALPKVSEFEAAGEPYEAVQGTLEQELEEIWKELLAMDTIGRKASFFKIGGNSLKCIQLISRVFKKYQVLVKINDIFTNRTIADLAKFIDNTQKGEFQDIKPLEKQEHYELSGAQQRFWSIHQVVENKSAYNVTAVYKLKGQLSVDKWKEALAGVVARHEILRTTFNMVDGQARQFIHSAIEMEQAFCYKDLSQEQAPLDRAIQEIREQSKQAFDLQNGPLFTMSIFKTNDEEYVYHINLHHIICDGWSLDILAGEMIEAYESLIGGEAWNKAPLSIQYKDYAKWQNDRQQSASFKAHKNYWVDQLDGFNPQVNLTDEQTGTEPTAAESQSAHFIVSAAQTQRLQQFAQEQEVSLFTLHLAMLNVLLYQFSGQNDLTIGSPAAGRTHASLEQQVGLYINTMLLRNRLNEEEHFSTYLQQVGNTVKQALSHQEYPLDLLIDDLREIRPDVQPDKYNIGFTYFNEDMVGGISKTTSGFTFEELENEFSFVKAGLWFKVVEQDDAFVYRINYSVARFNSSFIDKMIAGLNYLFQHTPESGSQNMDQLMKDMQAHLTAWEKDKSKSLKSQNLSKLRSLLEKA